ncbi:tubulin polyglutamylase TTLL5 isoform X1 [Anguilla anguilla]|uniref:tubulin polyglutamylase TTLL5 isoform X1 n=1 Tax=Anguilla anguilla TaxID=7936 RepID=UPI0015AEC5BB|nr:tubulin polyglutamylase TTLL5 isoform X1 [Anguilla anguilla]
MPAAIRDTEDYESSSEDEQEDHPCIVWCGISRKMPVLVFHAEAIVSKDGNIRSVGERYNLAYKIVRTESRLVRGMLTNHGFHEVHPNSNDFNLMWTGSHLKPYLLRNLQDFQKVNHFPRSYELTRKDRLYKNIQRMQQMHGFKNFHIVPQTFVLPSEFQEFCSYFSKDRGPWIIKPVASSRGRGIYLVSSPNQIPLDENILVSRYISNPLLIDDFKFDVRLYVLVTSYEPLIIYLYEEGLARFATVKYDRAAKNIKNQFMHLTNYSVNKKSRDYVSCDDPEVEDYGNKWSMSAILRYLKQEGKDTALLMGQVEDLVIKAVLSAELQIATACKMFVPHRTNCFELYGFDVLVDSNLKPWLLEVNLSPSLACDAPLDLKIKASMISDMFSLVGFPCQNPLARHPRPGRAAHDPGFRYQAQKCQRPSSAQPGAGSIKGGPRPISAHDADTNGLKEKLGGRKGDSTLGLTSEELKVLTRIKEEHERRGGFVRIFPTAQTWDQYSGYLEYKTSMNCMLATRLFPERSGLSGSVLLQVEAPRHAIQYERKLPSLEARKRRRRHLAQRSAPGKRRGARGHKAPSPESTDDEEAEEEEEEEDEEEKRKTAQPLPEKKQSDSPPEALNEPHKEAEQSDTQHRPATPPQPKPKINLLQILQQGWNLSKVQARMAFSSFLHRVQMRLLAESRGNGSSAWPEKDDDQMELVIRFLKRAAGNLRQDLRMVLPSRRLPLPDRRRILSHQLGEFLHCYNKETEQMVKKMEELKDEEHCVDPDIFQQFVAEASESDLEEVLTFYTQKNKSASVFLGTASRRPKASNGCTSSGESAQSQSRRAVSAAEEESGPCEPLPRGVGPSAPQPPVPASQPATVHPPALDCAHIHLQHCSPPPKSQPKCQGPPLVPLPLHPPPQTTAPTLPEATPPAPPPDSSQAPPLAPPHAPGPASLPRATWATACHGSAPLGHAPQEPPQRGRPCAQTPPTSVPSTAQIYSQKLSRPISARQASRKPSPSRSRPSSAGLSKDADALLPQSGSDQQAIVTALKKLAEKQAARQYSASSHISLLTQHLTNLNLANGAFSRAGFTLNPSVRHGTLTHGPVRAVRAETSPMRVPRDDGDTLSDGDAHGAYGLVTGVAPQQRYHPTSGSYQLQFAIQQLQQQKMQSRQLLDHSRARHQAILAAQNTAPPPATAPRPPVPPVPPGAAAGPWATHPPPQNQAHAKGGGPALAPKPPPSTREGLVRKTATQRLSRQCSSEARGGGGGAGSNAQHVVYEAVCGKAGMSLYSKLFQSYGSKNR